MTEISFKELRDKNRINEMKAICRFICTCNVYELAIILEEMRCYHDNLSAFNPCTKLLCKVKTVSINGEYVQLNLDDY